MTSKRDTNGHGALKASLLNDTVFLIRRSAAPTVNITSPEPNDEYYDYRRKIASDYMGEMSEGELTEFYNA